MFSEIDPLGCDKSGLSIRMVENRLVGCEIFNRRNAVITSVTDDSRQVKRGCLFVAIKGEKYDGHDFIPQALRNGASALLCEKLPVCMPDCTVIRVEDARQALSAVAALFFKTAEKGLKVIGVTGTNGKTTTTHLINAVLNGAGCRTGMLGTLSYNLGRRSVESSQTTPHPLALHSMLSEMRHADLTHAVMEVSSHSLVHRRVDHVPFDIAVLTNVTEDHLDFHGDIQSYARAKKMLFDQLTADSVAVLNADCVYWKDYARDTRATVLTYAVNNSIADVKLTEHYTNVDGTRMVISSPLETYEIRSGLVGDFNCENILAAVTVGFVSKIKRRDIVEAIEKFTGVPGRLERVSSGKREGMPSFFVDYAHTPDALEKILKTLRPLTKGQLICVFGCGGDRERQKRAKMGNIATSIADVSVITSDNSRSESTESIIADIVGGVNRSGGRYISDPDRARAIEMSLDISSSEDDVIVVCGKGAERFQHIGDSKIPFDDRSVCMQVMDGKAARKRRTA